MATNNAINLKSSGIVSYDGAGVFTALANPLTVANGGTGVASNTTYAVLTGGTTTTNPVQSIAGVGTTAQSLSSNGASNLPTFQNPGGYVFYTIGTTDNPADATTYLFAMGFGSAGTTPTDLASTKFMIPFSGTIKAAYGVMICTTGSAQTSTIKLTINNTTDVNITTTLDLSSSPATISNAALNTAVVAGDYIQVKWVTPTWTPTNPTNCTFSLSVYIQ